MVLMGVGLMIGAGCSVIASIHLSKGKNSLARASITQAMLFVTLISIIVGALILIIPEKIAYLLGASEHLLPMVVDYLTWFSPSLLIRTMDSCCLICNAIGWCSKTCYVV